MKSLWLKIALVWMVAFSAVSASENPKAVIIFDASGSMWGQINGVTKIEIARDTLKNVLKEWNPNVELGLTLYGHRSKGDCNDIETVIPVGRVDKESIIATVMRIKPKGKTPLSRSLKKVAKEIKYTQEKATIILISDGKETCDPNPCRVAKELEKNGIDFVVHVIGFDVDKKTAQELGCIAKATGGEYFPAKNATALNNAMKSIVKKVEIAEPKPISKPIIKKLKNNIEVSASEKVGGKWVKAYHRIYRAQNGKKVDRQLTSVNSTKKYAGETLLDEGSYLLQSEYNEFKVQTPFEIQAGEVTKLHIAMGQTGTIEISASEEKGGKWVKAYHRIYKVIDGVQDERQTKGISSYKDKEGDAQIAIGKYIVKSEYNKFKKETPFEIKAGETTKIKVIFTQFSLGANCSNPQEKVEYELYASSGQLIYEKSSECSNLLKVTLDSGNYTVEAKISTGVKETKFEVGAGHPTKLLLDLTNLNHQEEIEADSPAIQIQQELNSSSTIGE